MQSKKVKLAFAGMLILAISSISACRAAMAAGVSSAGRQWFCRLSENQELSASGKHKKQGRQKA